MDIRIYYEDTDAAGVVYHANYLKYFERARTEYFRDRGLGVAELAAAGYVFPVIRVETDFISPARHDDVVRVETLVDQVCGSFFCMHQRLIRGHDGKLLVDAHIKLACIGPNAKARRIPTEVRQILSAEQCTINA